MNQHILVAMDWENRSKEELEKNYDAAAADANAASLAAALDAAAAAAYAPTPFRSACAAAAYAYYASFAPFDDAAVAASFAALAAADVAFFAHNAAGITADVEYWVNKYFEETGEDRQEYEKALEEMKK